MNKTSWIIAAFVMALIGSLACNLGSKVTPTPVATIPVTTQAVMTLQTEVEGAAEELLSKGQTTLSITEEEMTSLVAFELQNQKNPPFRDPQIYLRDGQVWISGKAQQGNAEVNLQLILTLAADGSGRLHYDILSAKIGPLPLPKVMLEQLEAQLDRVFDNNIYPRMENIYIETITIQDGVMTIQGRNR